MRMGIQMEGIAHYHPVNRVKNDYYIKYYEEKGKEVRYLFETVYGRDQRYEIDLGDGVKENGLTMQMMAAKRVLKQCNLNGNDVDGIISVAQFPEFLVPVNAAYIHEIIHGKEDCFCFDMNMNCTGMVMAYYQAAKLIQGKDKIQRLLIVGGDYLTLRSHKDREDLYGVFGDLASAMIVTNDVTEKSGILDFENFIDKQLSKILPYPYLGSSLTLKTKLPEIYLASPEKINFPIERIAETIQEMLNRNHLNVEDITAFCFSQYVLLYRNKLCDKLGISYEKCPFIGDKYGYTGSTSPFLALEEMKRKNNLKRGDYVFFWTVGAGMQHVFLLMQY